MDDVTSTLEDEVNKMVRTKDELINALKEVIGDNNSDSAISLLEDVTDTFGDFENKLSDPEDWKKKFEENDKMWRKKYTDRFSSPVNKTDDNVEVETENEIDEENVEEKTPTFDDLFKTE